MMHGNSKAVVVALALTLAAPALAGPAVPDRVPSGGWFRQLRGWVTGDRTAAGALIKELSGMRGADRARAGQMIDRFFRDPQNGAQNIARTSIYDMGRLVRAAHKATGSDKLGYRMLRAYHRFWAPRLSGDQVSALINMTKGHNATQDAIVYTHAAHSIFGGVGQGPRASQAQVLAKEDALFSWLDNVRPATQLRLLDKYGKAFGKDGAWAQLKFDNYKTRKAAEEAEAAAEAAQTMALNASMHHTHHGPRIGHHGGGIRIHVGGPVIGGHHGRGPLGGPPLRGGFGGGGHHGGGHHGGGHHGRGR